jgi:hypothetical protein
MKITRNYHSVYTYDEPQHKHSILPNTRFFVFFFECLPVSRSPYEMVSYESLTAEEVGQVMGGN